MNKKYIDIALAILLVSALIIGVVLTNGNTDEKEAPEAVLQDNLQVPEPEVKEGHYTIFQYCQNGWTNHLYATAYYIEDHKIYAELREYPGEFIPIDGQTLLIPEWIEDADELMKYGFWEYPEEEYGW